MKILVVDDDPNIRELLKRVLSTDYTVETARNGEEGLRRAEENQPSIIITDYHLPGMDGPEMLDRISQKYTPDKVIIITGDPDERIKFYARERDYGLLTKPLDLNVLLLFLTE